MKRGFTLVEVLVVIVIIGLISLVAYPSILSVIRDAKNDAYESQVKIVEKAAQEFAVSNPLIVPDISMNDGICSCSSKCISIDKLADSGYLALDEVKNPKRGILTGGVEITCSCKAGASCNTCKYEYKYNEKITCEG